MTNQLYPKSRRYRKPVKPQNIKSPRQSKTIALQKSFTQPDIIDTETKKAPATNRGFPIKLFNQETKTSIQSPKVQA